MFGIEADAYGAPSCVDQSGGGVLQGKALEGWESRALGKCLGVVGDGARYWIPHYNDQFSLAVHCADTAGSLLGYKVAWCLLHSDLPIQSTGHQVSGWKEEISN